MERYAESFIYIHLLFILMYTTVLSRPIEDCSKTYLKPGSINIVLNGSVESRCHYRIKAPMHHVIVINITELKAIPATGLQEQPCLAEVLKKDIDVFGFELKSHSCCSQRTPFQLQSISNKLRIILRDSQECFLSSFIAIFSFHEKNESTHIGQIDGPLLQDTTSNFNNSIMSTVSTTIEDDEIEKTFFSNLTDKPNVIEEERQFDIIVIWIIAPTCLTLFCLVACCVIMSRRPRREHHHHQVYVAGPVDNQPPPMRSQLLKCRDAFSQVRQQEQLREQSKIIHGSKVCENYPATVTLPDGEGRTLIKRIFLDVSLENEHISVRAAPNVVVGIEGMQTDFVQASHEQQNPRGSPSLQHGSLYVDSVTRTSINILDNEDLPPYDTKRTTGCRMPKPTTGNAIKTKDNLQISATDNRLSEKKTWGKNKAKEEDS